MANNIKSAIIVAGAILIVALIAGGIYTSAKNKDSAGTSTSQTSTDTQSTTTSSKTKSKAADTTATTPTSTSTSGFITIDSTSLPEPVCTETVGIIQSKTIRLESNELYFSLDLLVGSENLQLSYIVGLNGYDAVSVGDKVTVQLATYTTDSGSVFYLVQGVQTID